MSKQVTNVVKDVLVPILKYQKKKRKLQKQLRDELGTKDELDRAARILNVENNPHLDGEDLKDARREAMENTIMVSWGGIVGEYEIIVQYAFVTLFACAFPCPFIVLLSTPFVVGSFVNMFTTQRASPFWGGIVKAWQEIIEILILRFSIIWAFNIHVRKF